MNLPCHISEEREILFVAVAKSFCILYLSQKCNPMLFIYGWRRKMVGAVDAFLYKCPFCEEINTTTIIVYSKYYHIFWIPIFPFAKEAHASCSSCNASRGDNKFGPELTKQANEIIKRFRHPFYLYMLTILFCLLILMIFIVAPKS